jgi:hypothetical protein
MPCGQTMRLAVRTVSILVLFICRTTPQTSGQLCVGESPEHDVGLRLARHAPALTQQTMGMTCSPLCNGMWESSSSHESAPEERRPEVGPRLHRVSIDQPVFTNQGEFSLILSPTQQTRLGIRK